MATTLSFLPWLYSDLATAFSRRLMVLVSSSYIYQLVSGKVSLHKSLFFFFIFFFFFFLFFSFLLVKGRNT